MFSKADNCGQQDTSVHQQTVAQHLLQLVTCPRNVPASRSSDPTSPQIPPSSPVCHHLFGDHLAATRLMGDTVSPLCADGRLLPNVILITARAPSFLIALLCPGDTVPARARVLRWSIVDGFICSATRVRSLLITPSSVGLR